MYQSLTLRCTAGSEGMKVFSEAYPGDLFKCILRDADECDIVKFKQHKGKYE